MEKTVTPYPQRGHSPIDTRQFRSGFVAMLPLWIGAIPVGLAYGVAARAAGLTIPETLLMSVVVFSATTQVSAVALIDDGASTLVIILTTIALNVQLLLIGLAIGRQEPTPRIARLLAASVLTEGAYGVALSTGRLTLASVTGAGVSMFLAWNLGTLIGAGAGATIPNLTELGVDFVAPLTFLAVLVPLLRTRPALLAAITTSITTVFLARLVPVGVVVLLAAGIGSMSGYWWSNRPVSVSGHRKESA